MGKQLSGYIKIHRKMLEWGWYDDVNTKVVFLHLLLTANFKDTEWHGIQLKRGDVVTSISNLAKALKLSERNVRTALKHLEVTGEVTSKSHSKFRIISIKNYNQYQEDDRQSDRQPTGNRQADDRQATGNRQQRKNDKNDKNDKNVVVEEIVQEFNSRCKSFDRIKTTTETAIMNIARLNNMYPDFDYKAYFDRIEKSDFLSGRNGRWNIGRCATFGWLTNPKNVAKVLRGQYDNKEPSKNTEDDGGSYDDPF